jgi:hypothetical protein
VREAAALRRCDARSRPGQNVPVTDSIDQIPDPATLDPQIADLLKRDEHGLGGLGG